MFRNIPGIRSESSGGDGNANIAIRGLPIASGGATFLQLQEDGLPVLEFRDITFDNADIFLHIPARRHERVVSRCHSRRLRLDLLVQFVRRGHQHDLQDR
ncbi:Plug domain-containing protein [Sphingomonas sp. S-NIH.Pt15_0812]|uniref:Plug domain-containing protein n=1 Tax=Sphingomonas sp. S-NIH.Pt15_0812 TaxID=1920129 RepID=UPI00321BB92E